MQKSIEIIVAPNGQVRLSTRGFVGRSCLAASEFLRRALGGQQRERRTEAFYASESLHDQQNQSQGQSQGQNQNQN